MLYREIRIHDHIEDKTQHFRNRNHW